MPPRRRAALLAASLALTASAGAQSTLRPLPRLAGYQYGPSEPHLATAPPPPLEAVLGLAEVPVETVGLEPAVEVELLAGAHAAADLDDGGSLETQRGGWRFAMVRALGGAELLGLEVEVEGSFYDFRGASAVVAGSQQPFNDLYRARVAASLQSPPASRLGYFSGVDLVLGGEDEVGVLEGLAVGAQAGMRYRAHEDLTLYVGLAAQSRLEDDTVVWPFLGLDWQLADGLRLELDGTEAELAARVSEHWSLLALADYQMRQFRLNEDGPLPDGALRDEEIRLALGAERSASRGLVLRALAGAIVWRELTLLEEGGGLEGETETDDALFVSLSLGGRF